MRILTAIAAALSLAAGLAAAPQPAGVVTTVSGKVSLFTAGGGSGKDLALGKTVFIGDRVKTGSNGRLALVLTDGTQLKVNYNTDMTLRDKDSRGKSSARGVASIKIALGDLWAKVTKKNSRLEFDTPAAVAAVKGTEPTFNVGQDGQTCIFLSTGKLDLSNELDGTASLDPKQQVCIKPHQKLSQDLVQPWDGDQSKTFVGKFQTSTTTKVEIDYTDRQAPDGQGKKSLILEYKK